MGRGNAASGPFPTTTGLSLAGFFFPLLQREAKEVQRVQVCAVIPLDDTFRRGARLTDAVPVRIYSLFLGSTGGGAAFDRITLEEKW